MLINNFSQEQLTTYSNYINCIASLSGLFSESKVPFLHYRTTEYIFCKSFQAENLSRADIAYDAKIHTVGIGIKTFISGMAKSEKVAEFNAHSHELRKLQTEDLLAKLSSLRNKRIEFANRTYGITKAIYHCLIRQENKICISESEYDSIHINDIKNIKQNDTSLSFEDDKNKYSYNFSKSTLYRKFYTPENSHIIPVRIIKNPYELLLKIFQNTQFEDQKELENVILPLYSTKDVKRKSVPERSGLNQWNASGRKRDFGEVYIPVPKNIHRYYPKFFPNKDEIFQLILPNQDTLSCRICQEGGKALMSNPNKKLSQWLLRETLKLNAGELATYEHLKNLNIDSVKITKINNNTFRIDFTKIDSYEEFLEPLTEKVE